MRQSAGRAKAEFQMQLRLKLLTLWNRTKIPWRASADGTQLRDADGELLLDYFPVYDVDLSEWTADKHSPGNATATYVFVDANGTEENLSLGDLGYISRSTMDKPYHAQLKRDLDTQVRLIQERAKTQLEQSRKTSIIENLESEVKYLRTVIQEQDNEARKARTEAREAKVKLEAQTRREKSNEAEFRKIIQQLETRISELIRDFSKIKPLSSAKDKS